MTHIVSAIMIIAISITGLFVPLDIYMERGAVVVDFFNPAFQLNGIIFGGYSDHEYMHFEQQRERGDMEYYVGVVIPSMISSVAYSCIKTSSLEEYQAVLRNYYSLPWEHQ